MLDEAVVAFFELAVLAIVVAYVVSANLGFREKWVDESVVLRAKNMTPPGSVTYVYSARPLSVEGLSGAVCIEVVDGEIRGCGG